MGVLRSDRVSGLGGANAINGSAHFQGGDGSNDTAWIKYIDAGVSEDYNFGTGDFTVECWINRKVITNDDTIWGATVAEASTGFTWFFNSSGNLRAVMAGSYKESSSNSISAGTWYHIAITRASGTMQMWVDGVSKYSATVSGNIGSSTQNFIIGNSNASYAGTSYHWLGHISNLRIQKGKAEYTAAFTPPTTKLEVTPETVLLACHDPGNVLAEATGKTLNLVKSGTVGSNSAGIVASRFVPDVGEDHGTTFGENTVFDTLSYMVPPGGTTAQSNRGRGVVLGGGRSGSPTKINTISYLEIPSTGISNDFGDLTESVIIAGCCASSTRGVRGGGYNTPTNSDTIDYVTIATTSNAIDFGNLTQARHWVMGGGSQTRGIFGGGNAGLSPNPNSNVIDYITIASTGNAADFGDLINSYTPTIGSGNAAASPTRLLFAGGSQDVPAPATVQNVIQYVTIASTGDATDFGDLTDNKVRFGVCSSSTRALYGGAGGSDSAKTNSITYVTIATTGNTVDFGDRTVGVNNVAATSNSLRGVFIGGLGSPTSENHIDYVNIATTGNAADWGDSFYVLEHTSACSDSHGGIA